MEFPMEFTSRRSPVMSLGGMVAASQPLAVAAGLKILESGGNAADAAIATAAALNVTEPTSTGIGGDCFALFFDHSVRQVFALNGSGRAPAALTLEKIHREGFLTELPPYHPYTITVPGACAGWSDLVERFGRLPLSAVLQPAIDLAARGFPVAPVTAYFWDRAARGQLSRSLNGREMTIDGRGPQPGEIFRNPGLARTLETVAQGGKDAFYQGPIAESIAATIQEAGGCLTVDDLAAHKSSWQTPISIDYRGARIWECPPNGQGLTALLALGILRGFELSGLDPLGPERLHLQIEALRMAFADAFYFIADSDTNPVPLDLLLSEDYLTERRSQINHKRANPKIAHGSPFSSSDTVYLSVVDSHGNACSFINSNYMGFGTGIVPHGWGFTLQNRGHNFSLDPRSANVLTPGKRPYHTIIPALATDVNSGDLLASFGVMGGFMQPQGHLQVACALFDDQVDPQSALDRPRFCLQPQEGEDAAVSMEKGIPFDTLARLSEMGHSIQPVSGHARALFGRGQIILRDPASGVLWGASDPRADGCAMSLG